MLKGFKKVEASGIPCKEGRLHRVVSNGGLRTIELSPDNHQNVQAAAIEVQLNMSVGVLHGHYIEQDDH